MPKVTPEYVEKKKEIIVDAALSACKRKTLSSLTMQDIIDESGLSQGGIYRFYSNIDEILAGLLDKVRAKPIFDDLSANIFGKYMADYEAAKAIADKEASFAARRILIKDAIGDYHRMMSESMIKYLFPYLKIEFEYNILITDYPERAKRIYSAVTRPYAFTRLMNSVAGILYNEVSEGSITPLVSLEDYFEFNCAVYDGILKSALSRNCYERNVKDNPEYIYDIEARFKTMYKTSCYLLGL